MAAVSTNTMPVAGTKASDSVSVIDPANRTGKITLPVGTLLVTAGLQQLQSGQGGMQDAALCMLFQRNRCRAGRRCRQIHADREVVQQLRQATAAQPTCCTEHGDGRSQEAEWKNLLDARHGGHVQLAQGAGTVNVPLHSLARTLAAERLLSRSDKVLRIRAEKICRLHQEERCRYGRDCSNFHLCRELHAGAANSNRMPASGQAACLPPTDTTPRAAPAATAQPRAAPTPVPAPTPTPTPTPAPAPAAARAPAPFSYAAALQKGAGSGPAPPQSRQQPQQKTAPTAELVAIAATVDAATPVKVKPTSVNDPKSVARTPSPGRAATPPLPRANVHSLAAPSHSSPAVTPMSAAPTTPPAPTMAGAGPGVLSALPNTLSLMPETPPLTFSPAPRTPPRSPVPMAVPVTVMAAPASPLPLPPSPPGRCQAATPPILAMDLSSSSSSTGSPGLSSEGSSPFGGGSACSTPDDTRPGCPAAAATTAPDLFGEDLMEQLRIAVSTLSSGPASHPHPRGGQARPPTGKVAEPDWLSTWPLGVF